MSTDAQEPRTDGGHALFGPMATGGEASTRRERAYRLYDIYVYAPASIMWNNWRAQVGTFLILFFVAMGTIGVHIYPEPTYGLADPYIGLFESWEYPLGTDRAGRPIDRQIVHATPPMLQMALAGAIFAVGVAVVVGVTSGFKGGKVDRMLMTACDVMICIPGLPLVIVLAAIFEPRSPFVVGVILAIDGWPGLARALRSQVLTIRESGYVEAQRAMAVDQGTIIRKDITPQLMPYILINAAQTMRAVIFESVALYFLGILPFTVTNWGVMMNLAYTQGGALSNLGRAGHWLFAPMLALILFSFGLVLFAQGMDSVFNPRIRARHAKTVTTDEESGQMV